MIRLCQKHFTELEKKWGGLDAIQRAYGNYQIVNSKDCENLECMEVWLHVRCPHCQREFKVLGEGLKLGPKAGAIK